MFDLAVYRIILFGSAQPRTTLASAGLLFKVPLCRPPSSVPGAALIRGKKSNESSFEIIRGYLISNSRKDRRVRLFGSSPETKAPWYRILIFCENQKYWTCWQEVSCMILIFCKNNRYWTCWREASRSWGICWTKPKLLRSSRLWATWRSSGWKPTKKECNLRMNN